MYLALGGQFERAREIMMTVDIAELDPQGLVAASWAVSRVGPDQLVPSLLARLEREAEEFLSMGDLPLGPRSTVAGLLEAGAGRLDRALDFFDDAVRVGDARAPLWGALARLEQGRVAHSVVAVGATDDSTNSSAVDHTLGSARTFFVAGGYGSLLARCDGVDQAVDAWSAPHGGRLVPGPRWAVGFGVQPPVDVRPSKGLAALHYLIAKRGRAVPAVELDLAANGHDTSSIADLFADKDIMVLSDEMYDRLIYDGQKFVSFAATSQTAFEKTLTFNAGSKTYSMTGWRCGYVAGPQPIIKGMSSLQSQTTSEIGRASRRERV